MNKEYKPTCRFIPSNIFNAFINNSKHSIVQAIPNLPILYSLSKKLNLILSN